MVMSVCRSCRRSTEGEQKLSSLVIIVLYEVLDGANASLLADHAEGLMDVAEHCGRLRNDGGGVVCIVLVVEVMICAGVLASCTWYQMRT
eukprot:4782973-Amphidinium_carterae.1